MPLFTYQNDQQKLTVDITSLSGSRYNKNMLIVITQVLPKTVYENFSSLQTTFYRYACE